MRWYHYALIFASFVTGAAIAEGEERTKVRTFEGPWVTTNRKLDGIMTAVVKDLGNEQWQGRFYGVWQGVPFDYTVKFSGTPDAFKGTANIDHADYNWTGKIEAGSEDTPAVFKATFGGSRYAGYFSMKEKKKGEAIAAVPKNATTR